MPNKDPISIVNEHMIFTFTEIDENAVFSDDSPYCVVMLYNEFGPRPISMKHINSTEEFILAFPNENTATHFLILHADLIDGHTKIEKISMIGNQKELTFAVLSRIEFVSNATTHELYERNAHTANNTTIALQHYSLNPLYMNREMPYPCKPNKNFSLKEDEYV